MVDLEIGRNTLVTQERFPTHLTLLESSILLALSRSQSSWTEQTFRKRRGELTSLALERWNMNESRLGDDLTRAGLHRLVEIAIDKERQSGIYDFPSIDKQHLDQRVKQRGPMIDWSLKIGIAHELTLADPGHGVQNWFNAIDLINARQDVNPKENPREIAHPELAEVLAKQFKKISTNRSVYKFGKKVPNPVYTPGLSYAYAAEDRFLSSQHALTTIGLFLAEFAPDYIPDNFEKINWLEGFSFQSNHPDFESAVKNLALCEDWVYSANKLYDLSMRRKLAA